MHSLHRFLSFAFLLLLVACGDERVVLEDLDAGVTDAGLPDMPAVDLGPTDAGPADLGEPDMFAGDMGPPCPELPIAPADPLAGEWSGRFYIPGAGGTAPADVLALTAAGDTIYVGGHFSFGNDVPALNVMAWTRDDGFRALGAGLEGTVVDLALHPTTGDLWAIQRIAAGGTQVDRWDGTTWSREVATDGTLQVLAFGDDGALHVGGSFGSIDGVSVINYAVRRAGAWSGATGGHPDGEVRAILVGADEVCLGGNFQNVGALESRSVACYGAGGWEAVGLPVSFYSVSALARDGAGDLIAGGHFDLDPADGDDGGSIARWTGTAWERLGEGFQGSVGPGYVQTLEVIDGTLFAAGSFARSGVTATVSVSRFDGSVWHDMGGAHAEMGFGIETNNVFDSPQDETGRLYIGGRFIRAGTQLANHVASWDAAFGWSSLDKPTSAAAGVGGTVNALAARGDCGVYAGGSFSYVGRQAARNVVRITRSGPEAVGAGLGGNVRALAVAEDGTVYAGGDLDEGNLLAYSGGATWRTLGGGVDGTVSVLRVASDGRLWVGGEFEAVGGERASNLAVWDGEAWSVPGGGVDGAVRAIHEQADGTVVVGGSFANAGTTAAVNVAAWDGTAWSAFGDGLPGESVGHGVGALVTHQGQLVASGTFASLPDAEGAGVARWTGSAWETVGNGLFSPYSFSPVYALSLVSIGDVLFVSGHNLRVTAEAEDTKLVVFRDDAWSAPLGELTDLAEDMIATPEGLFLGGTFTRAGDRPAVAVAEWVFDE